MAERQAEEARSELRRIEEALVSMERSRRAFLAQLRVICERQLAEIAAAEASPATLTAHIIDALAPDGRSGGTQPQSIQPPASIKGKA